MSNSDLENILDETGIPWSYGRDKEEEEKDLPYIVYGGVSENAFYADGIRYYKTDNIELALYTDKSGEEENILDETLTDYGIAFSKEEHYIASIDIYQILYEMEI